jgi:flagellin
MVINTNITAKAVASQLGESSKLLAKSLARLSSGSNLLSPEDDAAGLAVSMRFGAQISRTSATLANLANATSFAQAQNGYLQQVGKALDRMSELAVQAQDATKTNTDRSLYNKEFQTLAAYVSDAATKDFNGVSLFSGNALNVTSDSEGGTFSMQGISANFLTAATLDRTMNELFPGFTLGLFEATGPGAGQLWRTECFSNAPLHEVVSILNTALSATGNGSATYDIQTGKVTAIIAAGQSLADGTGPDRLLADLGLHDVDNSAGTTPITMTSASSIVPDISTRSGARTALATVKAAIGQLVSDQGTVGATLSRLSYTAKQLCVAKINLSAADSGIADADMARESTNYARNNMLVQCGTAMLAQANSMPQSVLRLLG